MAEAARLGGLLDANSAADRFWPPDMAPQPTQRPERLHTRPAAAVLRRGGRIERGLLLGAARDNRHWVAIRGGVGHVSWPGTRVRG